MIEPGISEISSFLKEKVAGFRNVPISYHEGKVISVGDGVARVAGLPGCLYGELLELRGCVYGMAMDLSADGLGAVLYALIICEDPVLRLALVFRFFHALKSKEKEKRA